MGQIQLDLDDDLHRHLTSLARERGNTVSDLIREAAGRAYPPIGVDERLETLRAVQGIWRNHEEIADAETWVRQLRSGTRQR